MAQVSSSSSVLNSSSGREEQECDSWLCQQLMNPHLITVLLATSVCLLLCCLPSVILIVHHLLHFFSPRPQLYYIRMLLMIPVWSLCAILLTFIPSSAVYVNTFLEVFEAYLFWIFFEYIIAICGGRHCLECCHQPSLLPTVKGCCCCCACHCHSPSIGRLMRVLDASFIPLLVIRPLFDLVLGVLYTSDVLSFTVWNILQTIVMQILTVVMVLLMVFISIVKPLLTTSSPVALRIFGWAQLMINLDLIGRGVFLTLTSKKWIPGGDDMAHVLRGYLFLGVLPLITLWCFFLFKPRPSSPATTSMKSGLLEYTVNEVSEPVVRSSFVRAALVSFNLVHLSLPNHCTHINTTADNDNNNNTNSDSTTTTPTPSI